MWVHVKLNIPEPNNLWIHSLDLNYASLKMGLENFRLLDVRKFEVSTPEKLRVVELDVGSA